GVDADIFHRTAQEQRDATVERGDLDPCELVDRRLKASCLRDPLDLGQDASHQLVVPASRAEIERKHALSRNDVLCAGTDRDLPTVPTPSACVRAMRSTARTIS